MEVAAARPGLGGAVVEGMPNPQAMQAMLSTLEKAMARSPGASQLRELTIAEARPLLEEAETERLVTSDSVRPRQGLLMLSQGWGQHLPGCVRCQLGLSLMPGVQRAGHACCSVPALAHSSALQLRRAGCAACGCFLVHAACWPLKPWPPQSRAQARAVFFLRQVTREAVAAVEADGIVFIDEIDKIVINHELRYGADASSEGVQRDLLPIIEGSVVSTKYGNVATDHILFICSGAFHSCKPSDMLAELQGRLPIRVELKGLTCAPYPFLDKSPAMC